MKEGEEVRSPHGHELSGLARIEENLRAFLLEARELALEAEVAAVRAEEDVARERLRQAEGAR